MAVDLFTMDIELAEIILSNYPGLMFEEQYHIDESETGERVYDFLNLDEIELLKFLGRTDARKKYEFEIRDTDGNFVEINRLNTSGLEHISEN